MASRTPRERREFLRFLAASPLAAALGCNAWAQQSSQGVYRAADAPSVADFEALSRAVLPPALGYLAELRLTMGQCGTPAIKDITRAAVKNS